MFYFLKHYAHSFYHNCDNDEKNHNKDLISALHAEKWDIVQTKHNKYELIHGSVKVLVRINTGHEDVTLSTSEKRYVQNFQVRSNEKRPAGTVFMYEEKTKNIVVELQRPFEESKNAYTPENIWRKAYDVPFILSAEQILKSWRYMRSPYLHKYATWMGKLGAIVVEEYGGHPRFSIGADPKGEFLLIKRNGSPKTESYKMLEKAWKMAPWRGLSPSKSQGGILCDNLIMVSTIPVNMSMHQKLEYYESVLNDPVMCEMEKFYNKSK